MRRLRKPSNGHSPQKSAPYIESDNAVAVRPSPQVNPSPQQQPMSATLRAALQLQSSSTGRSSEQYWAVRALSAETLLVARVEHQQELRSLSYEEEAKRARDIAAHDARYARLEKLVLALLVVILFLVLALLNLAHKAAQSPSAHSRRQPTHFTIPILSPFTSVVEHETSVIGTRTLTALALVIAVLAYFVFRHWLAHRRV